MIDEKYVDGVLAAGFHRGMLRIDFFSVDPASAPGAEEKRLPRQRLVMTPQAFAEAYAAFTGIMQRLHHAGLLGVPVPGGGVPAQPNTAPHAAQAGEGAYQGHSAGPAGRQAAGAPAGQGEPVGPTGQENPGGPGGSGGFSPNF